ncbi:LmbU family transcriptional regulator [Actinoplanes sp. CA-142083]|uniref:LmbU family transcriptional regulator n=1 Tax=Actinoplanes sp. CA-142083 TaxID=3239903 RepID=UPI003D8A4DA6
MTDHRLPSAQVTTTKVALRMPPGLPYDEWERAGNMLAGVLSSSSWWLGDWLIYGRQHYTGRYEQAIESAGLRYQTLRNYAWVAGRYPSARRRPALSFQHHAELAALTVAEQEHWLRQAVEHRWAVKHLRGAVRAAQRSESALIGSAGNLHRLAIPGERLERWREAAGQSGVDITQWIMATLDSAADQILIE